MFLDLRTMPAGLGWLAELNPLSAVATTTRELFTGTEAVGVSWAVDHAGLHALVSQLVLIAVFAAPEHPGLPRAWPMSRVSEESKTGAPRPA